MSKADKLLKALGYQSAERNLYDKHIGDGVFVSIYIDSENQSYSKTEQKGWEINSSEITMEEHLATHEKLKELGMI